MNYRILIIILLIPWMATPALSAKIYKWTDEGGILHISSKPPADNKVKYQTIVSAPKIKAQSLPILNKQSADKVARGPSPVNKKPANKPMPKKNIIPNTSETKIRDVITGSWTMTYDGGRSQLTYKPDGKFTYRNVNKRATFKHNGKWRVYKKYKYWYVSHKGKYFTKTKHGKNYSGAIDDLYIIKNLSGKKLILVEAKNRRHMKTGNYDLNYAR